MMKTKNKSSACLSLNENRLWCVCFIADMGDGYRQHKGDPIIKPEAERRLAWSRSYYPQIINWIEEA